MSSRIFTGLAAFALLAASLTACTTATDVGDEDDHSAAPELGKASSAATSQHWGAFTRSNVCRSDRKRKWSAILWDIPWGQSWEAACAKAKGNPNGIPSRVPDKCVTSVNEWGEWYLDDPTCQPPTATFASFTTSPTQPCADGLARFTFSARTNTTTCFRLRINGVYRDIGPSVCGTGDWTGSATVDLPSLFGANVPEQLTVEGLLQGSGQYLGTVQRTVTTQICN